MTLSLFLKTTDWPPNSAGLGVNACVPFCPWMVIVGEPGAADGVVAVEPPPPQPEAAVMLTNAKAVNSTRQFITSSFRESHSPVMRGGCKANTAWDRRESAGLHVVFLP